MLNITMHWLIDTTINGSLAIVVVLSLRWVFSRYLRAGWSYGLWIVVAIALVLPQPINISSSVIFSRFHPATLAMQLGKTLSDDLLVEPPVVPLDEPLTMSIDNRFLSALAASTPQPDVYPAIGDDGNGSMGNTSVGDPLALIHAGSPTYRQHHLAIVLLVIWLIGAVVMLRRFYAGFRDASRMVSAARRSKNHRVLKLFSKAREDYQPGVWSFRPAVKLRITDALRCPVSYGILKPAILLPARLQTLDDAELEMIFHHELTHHIRGDVTVNAVMLWIKSLHWFNPMVWLAHRLMRTDCELRCDQAVTSHLTQCGREAYGHLLVALVSRNVVGQHAHVTAGMAARIGEIRRRLVSLRDPIKDGGGRRAVMIACFVATMMVVLTSPVMPAEQHSILSVHVMLRPGELSALRTASKAKSAVDQRRTDRAVLEGILTRPADDGHYPAVVLMHGCEGFSDYQDKWAEQLARSGFVTLRISRNAFTDNYCEQTISEINTLTARQVIDAFEVIEYLESLDFVEGNNIGLMSWGSWAAIGATARYGAGQLFEDRFQSAVAVYPDCSATYGGEFTAPLMILVGENDQWANVDGCKAIKAAAQSHPKSNVDLKIYKNAHHGFDNPALTKPTSIPYARSLLNPSQQNAYAEYDGAADAEARSAVEAFFTDTLKRAP
ncbi:MAG: hypothetical protein DHS20C01_17280 [marine bacterium B5-7]|nr:MAG: hypothetical protein DHS20C01_17280 [marine bacterium B5-7]